MGAKVSVFQQDQITITVSHPKGLTWHKHELKQKNKSNHRKDEKFIEKQNQKSKNKNKIGLPPNKHYCLMPLARHIAIYLGIIIFGMQFPFHQIFQNSSQKIYFFPLFPF